MRTPRTARVEVNCIMFSYRVYSLERDGHSPPQIIACADDVDAEEQSRQLLEENVIEVWQNMRLVAVLTPDKIENRRP
jgi:hypothetical protein